MKRAYRTAGAILCLFAFGVMVMAMISSHHILVARHGAIAYVLELLIVASLIGLAIWWWRNREVIAKVSLVPSEADMIHAALAPQPMSAEDLEKTLLRARQSVGIPEAILNHVRGRMKLFESRVLMGTREDAFLIGWAIEHKYVAHDALTRAVHERLCAIGREVYEWHMVLPSLRYPDHSASPVALGYALLHGVVSDAEAINILFGHGETAEGYREKAQGLHASVMQQLAAGDTFVSVPSIMEGDFCLNCGC